MRAPVLSLFLTTLGLLSLLGASAWADDVTVQLPAGDGFVAKDGTGAIERLRVDEATGNISRNGALFIHTTGIDNTFVGVNAGNTSTAGVGNNAAFGRGALFANTTGYFNSAFGKNALSSNTTGVDNSALGKDALLSNETGSYNSAFGTFALFSNTTGDNNSAVGVDALQSNTTGSRNSALGVYALRSNTTGFYNSAVGADALRSNTTGLGNSAVGDDALGSNTTGSINSAFGASALSSNTTGYRNSAFGFDALRDSTTGSFNSAFGQKALQRNTTGTRNSAFGLYALSNNTTGNRNVAVGLSAGGNQTTGSNNIYLVNEGIGAESNQIKIGRVGTHTDAFIAGIDGNVVAGSAVLVTASGELGVAASSLRFKHAVRDMGAASERLMRLRPVTFEYREAVDGAVDGRHYGLIAEEVADVAPELVVYDDEGQPFSVRYHLLAPLLLNEIQKLAETNRALVSRLERLEASRGAGL